MLQRQIMFKQLQELQRKQQLQELGNTRNQNYANQISWLNHTSAGQFPTTVNGTPVEDSSRMYIVDNMQMMQLGGPNGLVFPQSHNHAVVAEGPSLQPDVSLYGAHASNTDKNFNQYSHLQGPSNLSIDLLTKSNGSPLGMATLQPSAFGSSFMNQRCGFSSEQISMAGRSLLSSPEKDLFGRVSTEGYNGGVLSVNYSEQGITMQRNASHLQSDGGHDEPETSASLDPLEQKILYSTDDNGWGSLFGGSEKMTTGGFESTVENASQTDALQSMQSGSWSALMQTALAETSSSDTGIQEEWSELSFQNPDTLNDNQPQDFIDSEKLQNSWVDRNSRSASSPGSNCFSSFQQPGHQYPKQNQEYPSVSSHGTTQHSPRNMRQLADNHAQQKHPAAGSQLIQTSLPSISSCATDNESHNNFSGHDFRGMFWLQGSTSYDAPGGIEKPSDQGMSNAISLTGHDMNDYTKNQHPAAFQDISELKIPNSSGPEFPILENLPVTQPSFTPDTLQHGRFPMGQPTPWQDMATHQDASSPKPYKFSSNLFRSPDSASSNHDTNSGARNELHNPNPFRHEQNVQEFSNYSGELNLREQRLEKESSLHAGSSEVNNSTSLSSTHMHQLHSTRTVVTDGVKSFPPKYDNVNYQQSIANVKGLFLSRQKFGVRDRAQNEMNDLSGKALSTGYHHNFQEMNMVSQNDALSRAVGSNKASNLMYPSQISLQMAPSWFKHYGNVNNGQMLPIYDQKASINAGSLQENSSNMQVNLANTSEGSVACKLLNPSRTLPSDVTNQALVVSLPKKRKLVSFDMIPWHKEVDHEQPRHQDISTAELAWAQASNRKQEGVTNEAEVVEELLPVIRAKRRLVCTTQLMQQVFRPAPGVILCSDGSSICDYVIYFAARLALGDACGLTSRLPSETSDVSPDKVKTSNRTNAGKFSKVVEGFISRVKKLEDDLSRLQKTLSLVDIKVEAQELEKFSLINRFAKFHIKAQSTTLDPASSSTLHKNNLQKYVIGLPMPKTVPEVTDCLSL